MQDHIRKLFEQGGFDALWEWAKDGKGKRERYRRFKALQRWAQGNRDNSSGDEREKWNARRKIYRAQKLRILRRIKDKPELGEGAWGGSESVLDATLLQVFIRHGIPRTSFKRTATLGNPSSDHWVGNTTAYAIDGGIGAAYWLHAEVAAEFRRKGIPLNAVPTDYAHVYCRTPNGNQYRYQGIASTHGTGPHYHGGCRLAS